MSTTIPGFTPTTSSSTTSTSNSLNTMTSKDFIKVMIAQLQQQDPLDPSKSDQLLTQMSQISQLESSQSLKDSLAGISLQQSIGSAGNLIGKTVNGIDDTGNQITGTCTSIKVQDKSVYLELDTGRELPIANVTQIANTSGQSSTAMQSVLANPNVQTLLSQLGLSGSNLSQAQLTQILSSPQGQAMLASLTQQSAASTTGTTDTTGGSSISGLLSMLGL